MSEFVSLPDELVFDDFSTAKLDLPRGDHALGDVLLGGVTEFGFRKASPGHESVASDVTVDSAIFDVMMSSPDSGSSEETGEQTLGQNVPDVGDISSIDFQDLDLLVGDEDPALLNYLIGQNDEAPADVPPTHTDAESSSAGSPQTFFSLDEAVEAVEALPVNPPSRVVTRARTQQQVPATIQPAPPSQSKNVVLRMVTNQPKSVKSKARPSASRGKVGPEEAEDEILEKNKKNAIQAKINREKKKAYMQGLEEQVTTLSNENENLKRTSQKLAKDKTALEEEVTYLKIGRAHV